MPFVVASTKAQSGCKVLMSWQLHHIIGHPMDDASWIQKPKAGNICRVLPAFFGRTRAVEPKESNP
jgi:hypothetical protein